MSTPSSISHLGGDQEVLGNRRNVPPFGRVATTPRLEQSQAESESEHRLLRGAARGCSIAQKIGERTFQYRVGCR